MRHPAIAGVRRREDLVLVLGVVEGVIEAGDHAGGIAKGRVDGDVLHPVAIDVDLAPVLELLEKLGAGHRRRAGDFPGGFRPFGKGCAGRDRPSRP